MKIIEMMTRLALISPGGQATLTICGDGSGSVTTPDHPDNEQRVVFRFAPYADFKGLLAEAVMDTALDTEKEQQGQ